MRTRLYRRLVWLALGAVAMGCTSPEATRLRAGGAGADTGNRTSVVQMHEGSEPYWKTPRRLPDRVQSPIGVARQADRLSRGQPDPAASPAETNRR
jgi:hypothetical protein